MQIEHEALNVHPGLEVSRSLMFSAPEVQDQFHIWMGKFEAVRWQPWLALGTHIIFAFWFPIRKAECGWVHFLALLSSAALPAARVALEMSGGAKQDQSICSTLSSAYVYAIAFAFQTLNDPCFVGTGPAGTSISAAATFAAIETIVGHFVAPCTMQHLPALFWTAGLGIVADLYMQYLQKNGGLMRIQTSDPDLLGLFAIVFGTSVASLVVYCTRVFLTKKLMVAFLNSIRRNR